MNGVIGVCFHPACYVLPKSLRRAKMQRHERDFALARQPEQKRAEELKRPAAAASVA